MPNKQQAITRTSSDTSHDAFTHHPTGENLDAVTAVTDSFKMADVFVGDRTGGAVAQTSAQTIGISMWQGKM